MSEESPVKHEYTSLVPQYKFATSREDQEEQLRANPMLRRFAESRRKLADDPHRPIYHYVNPEGRLNDPNGLCFWQGQWHLFYQGYPPEDTRQHWGHAVSDDLIHLGDYDQERDKLVATSHGKFNFGAVDPCGVCAPSATPDGKGGLITLFNMNHGRPSGEWAYPCGRRVVKPS